MRKYKPGMFRETAVTSLGEMLWRFLNLRENIVRLETATDLHHPATAGISRGLVLNFGVEVMPLRVRQMIGHMVAQIMADRGYVVEKYNVSISRSQLFSKGKRYRKL